MTTGKRLANDVTLREFFEELRLPRWQWWVLLVLLLAG